MKSQVVHFDSARICLEEIFSLSTSSRKEGIIAPCFAIANPNPKAQAIALRIASHIPVEWVRYFGIVT